MRRDREAGVLPARQWSRPSWIPVLIVAELALAGVVARLLGEVGSQSWMAVAFACSLACVLTGQICVLLEPSRRRLVRHPGLLLSVAWLVTVVVLSILAPLLPLGEHADTGLTVGVEGFLPPDLLSAHPLGTNQFGLDLLARLVWGSRPTLIVSVGAVAVGLLLGTVLGALAGHLGGRVDRVTGVVTNIGLAFPPLILLMIASPVVGRRTAPLTLVFAILIIPGVVRVARATTLSLSRREFILAARGLGSGDLRILFREVIPNLAPSLFVYGLMALPSVVVATASLSFLGLGPPQPNPTWGNMIAEGLNGIFEEHPFIVAVPSCALAATVLAIATVGRSVQRQQHSSTSKL